MNSKIVSTKTTSAIFLSIVLVTGTITLSSQSLFMTAYAQAQPYYYGVDNNYEKSKDSNSKSISLNKIKCINDNININGQNAGDVNVGNKGQGNLDADSYTGYYDGYGNNNKQSKGFDDCVINNNNNNTNIVSVGGASGNQTEPTTPATMTVNKEIYGCNIFAGVSMSCASLSNDELGWILCDDPTISNNMFCQNLTEDFFDIEILDEQGNQITQFEGSVQGTTIDNLEPGTYTVNEIKVTDPTVLDQLVQNDVIQSDCLTFNGFPDGGRLDRNLIQSTNIYHICFEYEDEQGNDCSTLTLATGEEKTCTVKNYIRFATLGAPRS